MWDCIECGIRNIAGSLLICPRCHVPKPTEEGSPSAGTSSLTSESKPDKSGISPPETESSLQSPAPDAENLSGKGRRQKQTSSSASLTDGSIQETGSGQASQQDSSEDSAAPTPATADQGSSSEQVPASGGFLVPGI
jgi:hypothetical protein